MQERKDRVIVVIAMFKLVKAVALGGAGLIALQLLKTGDDSRILDWAENGPLRGGGHDALHAVLSRVMGLPHNRLEIVGVALLAYAALFLVEGVGLLLRRRWAEYLTVIATASLIPLELYEIVQRVTAMRIAALVINAAVVAYLILRLRGTPRAS